MTKKSWGMLALLLTVLGGVNWGLVGLFKFDVLDAVFGTWPMLLRVVYVVVGVAALYTFSEGKKMMK